MKVIINADDFGANPGINKAIVQCAKDGHITSATILAVATHCDDAVKAVSQFPNISFGIHLALTGDFYALSQDKKLEKCDWKFRRLNIFSIPKIVREFSQQVEKLQSAGLAISHIDSHQHIQRYPIVLIAIMMVAHKYKIKKIRSQKMVEHKSLPNRAYRYIHHKFGTLMGMRQCDFYADFIAFEQNYSDLETQDISVEIMCHPGGQYNDEQYFNDAFYKHFRRNLINYDTF